MDQRLLIDKFKDYSRDELEQAIDQWVILRRHSERNRAMLKRYMIDGIPFEPLAEEFELSVRHTQNIIYRSQEQLFKHL